jgi:hypothetical protein
MDNSEPVLLTQCILRVVGVLVLQKLSSVPCVLVSDWNGTYYWSVFASHQGPVYATDSLESISWEV